MDAKQNRTTSGLNRNFPDQNSVSGKENNPVPDAKISSTRRVEQLLSEVRITACKTITNVKDSFDGISQKLRRSGRKTRPFRSMQQYQEMGEAVTPVKLYSPFNFATPSPAKSQVKRLTPKRFTFQSPSGTFKKDVKQLSLQVKELERVEKALCKRRRS